MFVSKKLRTLMKFATIEAPALRVPALGEQPELLNASFRVVVGQHLEVIADYLIETLAQGLRTQSGASNDLLVHGEGDVHLHSIRAHVLCVKDRIVERDLSLEVDSDNSVCYMDFDSNEIATHRDPLPLGESVCLLKN